PAVKITDGRLDLSGAYDDKIGAWDKVSIEFGYRDFPDGANERAELEKIIQKSLKEGLTFLSDQDARPRGGAHAYAHLWDNGKNPSDELKHVLEVRKIAISKFGDNNIKIGEPYAKLEEVLVPIYFFHRYQTEAAVKLIGGLNYRYALKGDGQLITEMVSRAEQEKALNSLLNTISPKELTLPESVIKMIPPRPIGYDRTREIINIRTGLTFDPIGAAESATYMTTSLLFNPARAQRLVEYSARNSNQLSLAEVIDKVISYTWKAKNQSGLNGEIQRTVNDVVLMNLMHLASNSSSGNQVKAIALLKIDELKKWLNANKNITDTNQKAHFMKALRDISEFESNPGKYKLQVPLAPPAGSPIGSGLMCNH
ncbi:MAG: zinc-dependent metalloprotease, partial [Bacteroidota bacterium]